MILKMIEELANPPVAARPAVVLAGMVALLSADALTEFATALVAADVVKAETLANAVKDALYQRLFNDDVYGAVDTTEAMRLVDMPPSFLEAELDAERHERIAAAILARAGALQ